MASFRILLPLLLLGLIEIKAAEISGLSYQDALKVAMSHFNKNSEEKNSYWITATEAQTKWDSESKEPQHLGFTVQETECLKTETNPLIECTIKTDGKVKHCQATVQFISHSETDVQVHCSPVPSNQMVKRTKRGARRGLTKVLKKIFGSIVKKAVSKGVAEGLKAVDEARKAEKKGKKH
ncbi:antibacterial peptide PMAP-36-like [Monodelphis domestica]|uniref:antibacterial peptide PMAP-36-like n=1 Tax=Monodelphis domestica TaxID=13616 RepID=UPI0004434DE9|nr:antibacterial peptide PMAP-36-like [Monodelphis domestica]